MKIYVAGKTHSYPLVRQVQGLCRTHHHEITYDWTAIVEEVGGPANERGVPPEQQARYAHADMMGVYHADVVIAVGHPHLAGTFIEIGMGVAWGKVIWLLNWHLARQTIFQHLQNFKDFGDRIDLLSAELQSLDPQRVGMTFDFTQVDQGLDPAESA